MQTSRSKTTTTTTTMESSTANDNPEDFQGASDDTKLSDFDRSSPLVLPAVMACGYQRVKIPKSGNSFPAFLVALEAPGSNNNDDDSANKTIKDDPSVTTPPTRSHKAGAIASVRQGVVRYVWRSKKDFLLLARGVATTADGPEREGPPSQPQLPKAALEKVAHESVVPWKRSPSAQHKEGEMGDHPSAAPDDVIPGCLRDPNLPNHFEARMTKSLRQLDQFLQAARAAAIEPSSSLSPQSKGAWDVFCRASDTGDLVAPDLGVSVPACIVKEDSDDMDENETADAKSSSLSTTTSVQESSRLGQYFASKENSQKVVECALEKILPLYRGGDVDSSNKRILFVEPSCGHGDIVLSLVEALIRHDIPPSAVRILACDIDPGAIQVCRQRKEFLSEASKSSNNNCKNETNSNGDGTSNYPVLWECKNFLETNFEQFLGAIGDTGDGSGDATKARSRELLVCCLGGPPYTTGQGSGSAIQRDLPEQFVRHSFTKWKANVVSFLLPDRYRESTIDALGERDSGSTIEHQKPSIRCETRELESSTFFFRGTDKVTQPSIIQTFCGPETPTVVETHPEGEVQSTSTPMETEKECNDAVNNVNTSTDAPAISYRSALDTTPRKVVVHNVLKFLSNKQVSKIVQSWLDDAAKPGGFHLKIEKYKKPPRNGWINVTVSEDCMVEPFIKLINGTKRVNKRGQVLFARRAGEESEKRQKRSRDDEDGSQGASNSKRARPDVPACPTPSQIRDKLTALWSESYPAQLDTKKKDMIRNCAFRIVKELKSKFRTMEKEAKRNPNHCAKINVFSWINEKESISVEDVIQSPLVTRYRNKCELTFGYRCPQESVSGDHTQNQSDNDQSMSEGRSKESNEEPDITKVETSPGIPTLGFLPYGWRHSVARPHCLQNIPDEVCAIADLIDDFLSSSPFAPYNTSLHRGLWRSVTIRSSERTGQVMVIVVHASPEGGAGEAKPASGDCSSMNKEKRTLFEKERDRLVSVLTKGDLVIPKRDLPSVQMARDTNLNDGEAEMGIESTEEKQENSLSDVTSAFRVTSIFFQEYNGLSNPSVSHPVQHAYGSKFIEEKLGKNTYQISPGAFFQVTTSGAEILYNVAADRIKELSNEPADTLLFDVCCGTGTIGLHCLAEGVVGRVVGIDISEPAIKDALENAKRNGFGDDENKGKTRFVASRAELVMGKELRRANIKGSIVAIVDPARDGLHPDVIKAIRSREEIKRLVYVSCNPTGSLVKDAAVLCGPATKKYRGRPFKPTRAQPVDMFPLTPHCEMVMTFDRMTDAEVQGNSEN